MKANEIQMRDPFVLVENGTYYLYGSTDPDIWSMGGGFEMYTSRDLENFEGPFNVFTPPTDFWGTKQFWAPEVYKYKGKYYMFATFFREGVTRGTMILTADSPFGAFVPLTNVPITPIEWRCLDGTFYVENGIPYIVFCREYRSLESFDGEMYLQRLSDDLRAPIGKPKFLFSASQAPWTKAQRWSSCPSPCYVTDGPFLYKGKNRLYLLWSSFANGYAITAAYSDNILGEWTQYDRPIREGNCGHGMVFKDLKGNLRLTVHTPNNTPCERPIFLMLKEDEFLHLEQ